MLRANYAPRSPITLLPGASWRACAQRLHQLVQALQDPGFRLEDRATGFGVIRLLLATAKMQGWNVLHTLTANPNCLIAELQVA